MKLYGIDVEATGRQIGFFMLANDYDIRELSKLMNVSYQAVHRWVRGKVLPEIQNLYILSQIFGVKIDDFIVSVREKNDRPAAQHRRLKMYAYYMTHSPAIVSFS